MNDELREGEKPVEPIIAQSFEGIPVTLMEGVLPMVTLDMPEGYPVGTHLRFTVEVRVANVRFEEGKGRHKGDFSRKHVLVTEGVELTGAFLPSELDSAVVGSAADASALVEDEDEPEQIEQLPLDPVFQEADVEVPGAVETLDQQVSRLAEEEAAKFAAIDEEHQQKIIDQLTISGGGNGINIESNPVEWLTQFVRNDLITQGSFQGTGLVDTWLAGISDGSAVMSAPGTPLISTGTNTGSSANAALRYDVEF